MDRSPGPSAWARTTPITHSNSSTQDLRYLNQEARPKSRIMGKRRARSVGASSEPEQRGSGFHKFSTFINTVLGSAMAQTTISNDQQYDSAFMPVPVSAGIGISRPLPAADAAVPVLPSRSPSPALSVSTSRFSLVTPPPPGAWIDQDPYPSSSNSSDGQAFGSTRSFFSSPKGREQIPSGSGTIGSHKSSRGLLPRIWDAISTPPKETMHRSKLRRRAKSRSRTHFPPADAGPLDGEEGELIDDEACFVELPHKFGLDIVGLLPTEIALYVLVHLDLDGILACQTVSKKWRKLASDNIVWRELFHRQQGWKVNAALARKRLNSNLSKSRLAASITSMTGVAQASTDVWHRRRLSAPASPSVRGSIYSSWSASTASLTGNPMPPLSLDWIGLYKTRLEISRRWAHGEPKVKRLTGHSDSVYCLEFDANKIVTGSRDRTIKVWSVKTGRLRQTLYGHEGSVLCLKFDSTDFMVSGSSDRQIFVWDLAKGLVKTVLKGHLGGVLDLRIDDNWIVSCSKDAIIRVWRRDTLEPHCALVGHDGPVNAVGMQNGKIVSASGDGRMMFWDIEQKTKIRTFDGHDRGLACIEFKGDLIISGSNDCKIKIWSATTGECLQTLVGHSLLVRALCFDPHLNRLVSASYDRSIKIWDLKEMKCVREFRNNHDSHIFDVKFDVGRIVSTSHDQNIVVLDFASELDTTLFC